MQTKATTKEAKKTNGSNGAAYGPHSPLEALGGTKPTETTRAGIAAQLSAIRSDPKLTEPERQIITIAASLVNNGDKALVGLHAPLILSLAAAADRMEQVGLEDPSLAMLLGNIKRLDDLPAATDTGEGQKAKERGEAGGPQREDFHRHRLIHDVAGLPDEPPFHIGYDLMTTLEHEQDGGTDADPTETLLKRALEQIHFTQELTDEHVEHLEKAWCEDLKKRGLWTEHHRRDRALIRRELAAKALSFAEGLVDHAKRLHSQQIDALARRVLGQPARDRRSELGFDLRDTAHVELAAALEKGGAL